MADNGRRLAALAELVEGALVDPGGGIEPLIQDVTHDSRQAGPGVLFVAIPGASFDGHEFVRDATTAGSPAVVVEHPVGSGVFEIVVESSRRALGPLAAEVHGHPSRHLDVIGVTGTNGKTTVTHNVVSIARTAGVRAGLVGTISARIGEHELPSPRTTPEASDFQRLLAEMLARGARVVAAEVSSHALELGRVDATRFSVAAFTNLSQDHLDFHGDMQSYLDAKRRLFFEMEVGTAVVNVDDSAGSEIARDYRGNLITVGADGDVRASECRFGDSGCQLRLVTPWGNAELTIPVVGRFNLSNALIASACWLARGETSIETVVEGLESLDPVPGRFEVVSGSHPIRVIVDYAHTPRGISAAIETTRAISSGRVIAMGGAGGDRDRGKRPQMGAALAAADVVIVTSDNPRSEDPEEIVADVVSDLGDESDVIVEVDRRRAIHVAIGLAAPGDTVLLLGRGHETMQEVGSEMIPFDDRVVAREALQRRSSPGSGQRSGSMSS